MGKRSFFGARGAWLPMEVLVKAILLRLMRTTLAHMIGPDELRSPWCLSTGFAFATQKELLRHFNWTTNIESDLSPVFQLGGQPRHVGCLMLDKHEGNNIKVSGARRPIVTSADEIENVIKAYGVNMSSGGGRMQE